MSGLKWELTVNSTARKKPKNPRQQAAQSIVWLWSEKFKDWKIMYISSIVMGWRWRLSHGDVWYPAARAVTEGNQPVGKANPPRREGTGLLKGKPLWMNGGEYRQDDSRNVWAHLHWLEELIQKEIWSMVVSTEIQEAALGRGVNFPSRRGQDPESSRSGIYLTAKIQIWEELLRNLGWDGVCMRG